MREIKFRGKRVDNGEWIYGYYHCLTNSNTHCIDVPMADFDNSILWHVKAKTVGQYTGLKDKDGREIFEGDIVTHNGVNLTAKMNNKVIIEFIDGAFCLKATGQTVLCDSAITIRDCMFEARNYINDELKLEIIGNVHDNPELLEERRDSND